MSCVIIMFQKSVHENDSVRFVKETIMLRGRGENTRVALCVSEEKEARDEEGLVK